MGDVSVSISEVIEVRGCRLNDEELLALIIIACEQLTKTPAGVFTPDHVFVHMFGDLEIKVVSADQVSPEYVPPEIRDGNTNPDAGAVHVFCLGEVIRFAGAAESSNTDIFSLLNVMTVAHVATRPSIVRLAQMAKNKLSIQNPKALLAEMYVLVMGDEAEDIEDFDASSGEYVLAALGEDGELKETRWSRDEIGPPALSSTKIKEEDSEETDEQMDADKKWLTTSVADEDEIDPFENTDAGNLATLSGRDPFNSDFLVNSSSKPASVEQHDAAGGDEPRKEKQRKLLIDASDMLMGSPMIEAFDKPTEKEPKKKPLSWPEPGSRHEFDYDDDIVEYKEEEPEEDETSKLPVDEVLKVKESASTFEFFGRPPADFSQTIRVTPIVERTETPTSLSPISEASENIEKDSTRHASQTNESSISSTPQSSPEKVSPITTIPPPRFIKNNEHNKVSQVIPEDEELSALPNENEGIRRTWFEEEDNEGTPAHVDAIVLEKPKPSYKENAGSSVCVLRRDTEARSTEITPNEAKGSSQEEEPDESVQHFSRRNSLVPSRISGRKPSLRHAKRKGRAEPEFATNIDAPSVCLKAPAMRKKKMSLHRIEQTGVTVELLNGKRIEVSCRSDAVASEVADVVMRHINFNENSFFGLTVLRDGEHFFLEDHQRLEKFAPAGWKNAHQHGSVRHPYVLHLRFRYYPATIDFIKTDVVLHELYLQLRRDVLEDRLQPPRDTVFELAALALQAEFSDRPNPAIVDYFQLEHYLPRRSRDNNDERRIMTVLSELHSHYSGLKSREAEMQYIMRCQRLADYGGHFHRVYKSKPSSNLGNTPLGDPQTGTAQWIGILPRGIVQYEEHRGMRQPVAEHLWQNTQTLQFDKKRFVIVSEVHQPPQSVFYTDHYTKSAYFVRFAASQHRFMIKMRHWNQTLQNESTMRNMKAPDVGADTEYQRAGSPLAQHLASGKGKRTPQSEINAPEFDLEKASDMFPKVSANKRPSMQMNDTFSTNRRRSAEAASNISSSESPSDRLREASPEDDSSECGEGSRFEVILKKDPKIGLGLTLVDGNLNGIKGVYVKSVTEGGPGKRNGVMVGDRLMSVNDVSLIGKDRHATVDLVRQSGEVVRLSIFRLDAVSTALTSTKKKEENGVSTLNNTSFAFKSPAAPATTRSRTPPPPRKVNAPKKRQRAVSDFGAVGDALPELNSEDLLANIRKESRLKASPRRANREDGERGADLKLPASSMYKFEGVEDDESTNGNGDPTSLATSDSYHNDRRVQNGWSSSNGGVATLRASSDDAWMNGRSKTSNLDWTDDLEDLSDERPRDIVAVRLERNESGSLGVQIASSGGAVYIKQLTAEPAVSNPDIHVGDRLVSVNGERLDNLTHQQVVALLRNGGSSVVLGLQRSAGETADPIEESNEQTITVILEKSPTGSLGLSLAKKTGYDGIFIRMIGSGSAADVDGTLRVGDKIWQVNGQLVNNSTPGAIVDLLKSANNPVEIIVKRTFFS
uniref:Tyrosine-protein phosphatase non-receptor type 13 n=1 Tax=Ascaris suum TaxID=6253 RepID=F1KQZ6_ASCSU